MDSLPLLYIPIVLVVFSLAVVNALKMWFHTNYSLWPARFFGVFAVVSGVSFLYAPISLFFIDIVFLIVGFLGYIAFSWWWGQRFAKYQLYDTERFSVPQQDIAPPNVRSAFPKAIEVLVQDFAALSLIILLSAYFQSILTVTLLFVSIVLVLHSFSPVLFGKFYGWYFLVSSGFWALFLPYMVTEWPIWIGGIYLIHLGMYVLMYFIALSFGSDTSKSTA